MAYTFTNVATTDTFSTWLTRTNQMASAFANVVTIGGAAAAATGNANITGTFTANTLVTNAISSVGTLNINSNTEIGSTSKLTTLGAVQFRGSFEIDDITSVKTFSSVLSANATHYLLASNSANNNTLYFSPAPSTFSTNATFSANVSIQGRLVVSNNSTFTNVTVSNSFTSSNVSIFSNTVSVSGNATFASNVSFSGNITSSANVIFLQHLTVVNTVSFSNTLSLGGTLTVKAINANGGIGSAGQVLTSNGTGTYWSSTSGGSGSVTSVLSGNGLTGGPITSTGTLSVQAANGISVAAGGVRVNAQNGLVSNTSGLYVNASAILYGTLEVAQGGTGRNTFTAGSLLRGNGTGAVTAASAADVVSVIGTTNVANASYALNSGVAVVANTVDNQNSSSDLKMWTGTASEYISVSPKDSNTLYFVTT